MAQQILIEKDGVEITVSEKAFELVYAPAGYTAASEPFEAPEFFEYESETNTKQSALENVGETRGSGSSRAAVGRGTGKSDKAKDS